MNCLVNHCVLIVRIHKTKALSSMKRSIYSKVVNMIRCVVFVKTCESDNSTILGYYTSAGVDSYAEEVG